MELSKIEKLLEKYFEGETTISEEKELKVYFTGDNVPSHLEKYKSMFQFFSDQRAVVAPSGIRLPGTSHRTTWYKWGGVAASIALIAGIFITDINKPVVNEVDVDTFEDPEVALQKTKEVLSLVSQYMNEGKRDLVYLKEFENTRNKLIK
ncbi:hypothetical protein ACFSTE_14180 [Aquimarina hainanensis]|uniref:Anti sigma-E protein RseA N-terminal domain-containing protein n=1 Tax=Aquimarina hainanensis TaxID=1578017 RepID=A0ABW5N8P6_9FLAO|nr:hypothetical protein [Aquimarina sp. TRL1]QKX06286.1 hypothetical protein HN014_15665 [Aquimarina sp. TRL1]